MLNKIIKTIFVKIILSYFDGTADAIREWIIASFIE